MTEPRYKWEIAIAGLIHDIGKFYQKSNSSTVAGIKVRKNSAEHPLHANDFIDKHIKIFAIPDLDVDCIRACAVYHHNSPNFAELKIDSDNAPSNYKKYCKIVDSADNISSSERDVNSGSDNKELATLEPFFVRFLGTTESRKHAYKLDKYSNYRFKIINNSNGKHDEKSVDDFITNFESDIDKINTTTPESLFNQLCRVIKDYTWCIPANVREKTRDISLYQHLITTSAIASAIYSDLVACSEDENFTISAVKTKDENIKLIHITMVNADSYILKTSNNTMDILDEINSRRTYLETEYEYATADIVKAIELTSANKVIDSGFDTYILFGDQSEKEVVSTIRNINESFKERFFGDIYLSYSIQDLSFNTKDGKSKTMKSIFSNKSEYMVDGLGETLLDKSGDWDLNKFIVQSKGITEPNLSTSIEFNEFKQTLKEYGNKIAFICIDGDNIIEKMTTGFDEVNERGTISRISTYANILRAFFDDYVRSSFDDEDKYFINVNANKVIIASSINGIIDTAYDIREMFRYYTLGTMDLSISIHVFNLNERLSNIVNLSNTSLKETKLHKKKDEYRGCFLYYKGLRLTQADCKSYMNLATAVENSCGNISALRRVATYSQMYKNYIRTKDVTQLMCHPLYTKNKSKDSQQLDEGLIEALNKGFNEVFKGSKAINRELFLLENIIDDTLITQRTGGN